MCLFIKEYFKNGSRYLLQKFSYNGLLLLIPVYMLFGVGIFFSHRSLQLIQDWSQCGGYNRTIGILSPRDNLRNEKIRFTQVPRYIFALTLCRIKKKRRTDRTNSRVSRKLRVPTTIWVITVGITQHKQRLYPLQFTRYKRSHNISCSFYSRRDLSSFSDRAHVFRSKKPKNERFCLFMFVVSRGGSIIFQLPFNASTYA